MLHKPLECFNAECGSLIRIFLIVEWTTVQQLVRRSCSLNLFYPNRANSLSTDLSKLTTILRQFSRTISLNCSSSVNHNFSWFGNLDWKNESSSLLSNKYSSRLLNNCSKGLSYFIVDQTKTLCDPFQQNQASCSSQFTRKLFEEIRTCLSQHSSNTHSVLVTNEFITFYWP